MLKRITATVLLLAMFGVVWTSSAEDNATASGNAGGPSVASASQSAMNGGAASMNESSYRDFLGTVQSMYREDFNYSGSVLKNYVNKTISERDAMVATTSIFVLTSQSVALLETNKPPAAYASAYNNTLQALTNLSAFLWNMSKFYETAETNETKKNYYLVRARNNLNESVSYYKMGQEVLMSSKP
jgi:hypothetical protein